MKKIEPGDPETRSADIVAGNIEQIKALFPEAVTEGRIDFEVLKQVLGEAIDDKNEKYGLNWHGKKRARQLALTPSNGTLRPCPEESVDWDTTQNIFIEGDNLEVLKLLQKSYAGKVKLIYIDPPYNNGADFVYPDAFKDTIKNYLELTGQADSAGNKIIANTEASGRFHAAWLSMMYPRLQLARNLLSSDGILLVSIDDIEFAQLRFLLDAVFGSENFEATLIWEGGRKNDARRVSVGHDYVVIYSKDLSVLKAKDVRWRERKVGLEDIYEKAAEIRKAHAPDFDAASKALQEWFKTLPDGSAAKDHSHYKMVDEIGVWYGDNISSPNPRQNLMFVWRGYAPPPNGWRYDQAAMERLDEEGLLIYPDDKSNRIQYKRYLHHTEDWAISSVFYKDRRAASKGLKALLGEDVFDFPKDVDVLCRLIKAITAPSDIVLDFFAGSGTTGHAVMKLNALDGGERRFILVQLPEPLDVGKPSQKAAASYCMALDHPPNIAELTKERLRRSAKKIRDEAPMFVGDLGFRVFRLDSSNVRAWAAGENLRGSLDEAVDNLLEGRSEADLLSELLLKLDLDLCAPTGRRVIAKKTVYFVGGGVLIACLTEQITRGDAEPLALGIAAWHKELAPAGETTIVFRDSAFEDDVAKTNVAAVLEQHGLANVKSL